MIYIIKAESTPLQFKIGRSNDPIGRLNKLQTGSSVRLEIAAILNVHDDKASERIIHRLLNRFRTRGEWFEGCKGIDLLIGLDNCNWRVSEFDLMEILSDHRGEDSGKPFALDPKDQAAAEKLAAQFDQVRRRQ